MAVEHGLQPVDRCIRLDPSFQFERGTRSRWSATTVSSSTDISQGDIQPGPDSRGDPEPFDSAHLLVQKIGFMADRATASRHCMACPAGNVDAWIFCLRMDAGHLPHSEGGGVGGCGVGPDRGIDSGQFSQLDGLVNSRNPDPPAWLRQLYVPQAPWPYSRGQSILYGEGPGSEVWRQDEGPVHPIIMARNFGAGDVFHRFSGPRKSTPRQVHGRPRFAAVSAGQLLKLQLARDSCSNCS